MVKFRLVPNSYFVLTPMTYEHCFGQLLLLLGYNLDGVASNVYI